jgi:ribonuclease Z
MAIDYQILGGPGCDNALLVTVDSGQSVHRLLFDCGGGCLSGLSTAEIHDIEVIFFSHFHLDHVAGFDSFLRVNWCRPEKPVRIFGPPGTIDIIHHRLRGYIWNLATNSPGEWLVTEMDGELLRTAQFFATEGFAPRHEVGTSEHAGAAYRGDCFAVDAIALDHGTPSIAYTVRENGHTNVAAGRLDPLQMQPGPWLKILKDAATPDDRQIEIQGSAHRVGDLREQLLEHTPGDSIAYLTDFSLKIPGDEDRLAGFLAGCRTLVCESNYRNAEAALATKHHHMTSAGVAAIACRVQPEKLILFHLSDRYTVEDWQEQLAEVRGEFARAEYPEGWF